jgi:UDP-glucose 4-epimerase
MRCLVTGGAGFVGSHLCDALIARGAEVSCVDNLHLGREENVTHLQGSPRFQFQRADVLDAVQLDAIFTAGRFDAVFHLAANSDIRQGTSDHEIDLRLTFMTTYGVLEAMLRHDVHRIFFASSSAVFGETTTPLHEGSGPLQPISFYGAAKLAAEGYLSAYVHNHGFRATVVRFPNVVGERATHGVLLDFIRRLQTNPSMLTVLGDGRQSKPYMYIGDLIRAILLVFDQDLPGLNLYHVGGEDRTSVQEIATIVREELGLADAVIEYTGGNRGWSGDVPYFSYDSSRIAALGFERHYNSTDAVRVAVRQLLGKP